MTRSLAGLRGRLSYANVTASLALFIALGGTGYAATRLPRNSVASPQIVDRSILAQDLHSSTKPRTVEIIAGSDGAEIRVNGRPNPRAAQVIPGAVPGLYFVRLRRSKNERCLPGGPYASGGVQSVRAAASFSGDQRGQSTYEVAVTRLDGSPLDEDFYFPFLCTPGLGETMTG